MKDIRVDNIRQEQLQLNEGCNPQAKYVNVGGANVGGANVGGWKSNIMLHSHSSTFTFFYMTCYGGIGIDIVVDTTDISSY